MNNDNLEALMLGVMQIGAIVSITSPYTREYANVFYYLGDWDGVSSPTSLSIAPATICCLIGKKLNNKALECVGRYIPMATTAVMYGLMMATELGAKIHPIIDNRPDIRDIPWLVLATGVSLGYSYLFSKNHNTQYNNIQ